MSETNKKWLAEVGMPTCKTYAKNRGKGLIPRFHRELSDQFYGGTQVALSKVCAELATDGFLHKAFVKFSPAKDDIIGDPDEKGLSLITDGPHKGMKVGKDGRLSTPIYWIKGDPDIPDWAKADRGTSFRTGEEWFKKQNSSATE